MIMTKQDSVYQQIKEYILVGKIKNSTRVTERALAKKFNVTRVPIRESLLKLEHDGLIRKIPSVGYIAENYSSEELEEAMLLRFILECQAASKAAENATEEDIVTLEAVNKALRDAGVAHNLEIAVELDREFHLEIIKASHSKLLNKLYSIISIPVFRDLTVTSQSSVAITFKQHSRIIEAIKNKNTEEAFTLILKHVPGRENFKNTFYSDIARNALLDNQREVR